MRNLVRIHPLMSDAFIIWLTLLGYKGVNRAGDIQFYHKVSNKNFPRDVMIMRNGRLNKAATQLFKEFKKYNPFGETA